MTDPATELIAQAMTSLAELLKNVCSEIMTSGAKFRDLERLNHPEYRRRLAQIIVQHIMGQQ